MPARARASATPGLLAIGVVLALFGLRSLGVLSLVPPGASAGLAGEVLASRPVNLKLARATPPLPRATPTRIEIPAIGVDAPIQPLGLDKDGRVQVPPLSRPSLTGWYQPGPAPGQRGGAVILGHVDTRRNGPAVFYKLRQLRPGSSIKVRRSDGDTAVFQVDSVERFPRDDFPTERVYGPLDYPGLRLVTCGGQFDYQRHEYEDNVMVFASGRG